MRLAYVTSRFPFGRGEAFLAPEIAALAGQVESLVVVPMRARGELLHADARVVLPSVEAASGLSWDVIRAAAKSAADPIRTRNVLRRLAASRSPRILAKNVVVAPKASWLAQRLRSERIDHVHVHWGGASSTMAMLAAESAGVPWSLTLHRWDIAEDNLLAAKVASATFTRVISRRGLGDVLKRVPGAQVDVIHMGVDIAETTVRDTAGGSFRIAAIGSLVPVKGHAVLLEALSTVPTVELELVGDGPLRHELERQVTAAGLTGRVRFSGFMPHDVLISELRAGRWHAVVQPSIDDADLHEGIPVALMEAMSAQVPVVATRSGGTAELVEDAGLLVAPGDAAGLAEAITELATSERRCAELARAGYERVRDEYDARTIAGLLVDRFTTAPTMVAAA
jgi:colanic acid/amylovoran biosynthesis glycosyltransferase